jgi:hypothetical protein
MSDYIDWYTYEEVKKFYKSYMANRLQIDVYKEKAKQSYFYWY